MAAIEIDTETVNRVVADAILNSSLGMYLRKLAEDHVKLLHQSYNNPVKAALEQETFKVVQEIVQKELRPKIEEIVREKMTDEVVQECAAAAWNTLQNAIGKNRY